MQSFGTLVIRAIEQLGGSWLWYSRNCLWNVENWQLKCTFPCFKKTWLAVKSFLPSEYLRQALCCNFLYMMGLTLVLCSCERERERERPKQELSSLFLYKTWEVLFSASNDKPILILSMQCSGHLLIFQIFQWPFVNCRPLQLYKGAPP